MTGTPKHITNVGLDIPLRYKTIKNLGEGTYISQREMRRFKKKSKIERSKECIYRT